MTWLRPWETLLLSPEYSNLWYNPYLSGAAIKQGIFHRVQGSKERIRDHRLANEPKTVQFQLHRKTADSDRNFTGNLCKFHSIRFTSCCISYSVSASYESWHFSKLLKQVFATLITSCQVGKDTKFSSLGSPFRLFWISIMIVTRWNLRVIIL